MSLSIRRSPLIGWIVAARIFLHVTKLDLMERSEDPNSAE